MDYVLKGLLANNIVQLGYASKYGFPTMGVFTTNPQFIEEEGVTLDKSNFFAAFDFARKKVVSLDNYGEIISIQVYNPAATPPADLVAGTSWPIKSQRDTIIKSFMSQGAPSKFLARMEDLPRDDAEVFVSFFLTENFSDLSDEELFQCLEDLRYSSLFSAEVWIGNYEHLFGVDFESPFTQETVDAAAKKWFSLIRAYGKLLIMELQRVGAEKESGIEALITEIAGFEFPGDGYFVDYKDIIDYWPYLFNPRPSELPLSPTFFGTS